MLALNLKSLISKLNATCHKSLESAAGLCLSRTNYNVEIEHWLLKILESSDSDLAAIAKAYEIDVANWTAELTKALDKLKTGNARPPALSQNVVDLARDAWLIASVEYNLAQARSGHLILAILADDAVNRMVAGSSDEFEKIKLDSLKADYNKICADTVEAQQAYEARPGAPVATPGQPGKPGGPTKTPSLDQFTIDLTLRAKQGGIDPVLGRDDEIRQIIDILSRRRQNNPILTGEAGVGKTAVAEGFALRIAAEDVPPDLKNVSLRMLDLALLQAGAGVKGEFENRLKSVIEEVKSSETPIILFIDEAHTMIGAGGQAGQGDAANLLKPALARGELRTIAATTWAEYKKYFESDAALSRRFQVVKVEEPSTTSAISMMRGLVKTLEKHHKVRILNEAVEDAVKLSSRYISGRQLPDKAVSLLDTACARIGLSQNSIPPAIEDCQRRIDQLTVSADILERESIAGVDHSKRIEEIQTEKEEVKTQLETLNERWQLEKDLVKAINEMRSQINQEPSSNGDEKAEGEKEAKGEAEKPLSDDDVKAMETKLQEHESKLRDSQGEAPLVHACCDSNAVAETVASWTGIPVGRMMADEIKTVMQLKDLMEESIVGQSHALDQIAVSIQTSRAKLTDPKRPIGVFLLAGTSGVGKTETALTLARLLYGGEQNLTIIDMSQLKSQEMAQTKLFGSTKGYVGYGEGGLLTEAVRRKPYSVILLDEFEKAHEDVQDTFYQIFDAGHAQDGEGRDIDFRNTVIMMTTNAGTDFIKNLCADPETAPEPEGFAQAIFPEMIKSFKPAFLGRLTIVPYYPLSDEVMKQIVRLKLGKIGSRVRDNYDAGFSFTDAVVDLVASRCTEVDTGARNVDKILNRSLLPDLSSEFLATMAAGNEINGVEIGISEEDEFTYTLS